MSFSQDQQGTCASQGFVRRLLSNDWQDVTRKLTDGLSVTAAGWVQLFFVVYLAIAGLLMLVAAWTAFRQFTVIMRPCLPSALRRGYWKDDGPLDRARFRMRWPTITLLAMIFSIWTALIGAVVSVAWPLWLPTFVPMVLWDTGGEFVHWAKNDPEEVLEEGSDGGGGGGGGRQEGVRNGHSKRSSSSRRHRKGTRKRQVRGCGCGSCLYQCLWILMWPLSMVSILVTMVFSKVFLRPFSAFLRPITTRYLWYIPGMSFLASWGIPVPLRPRDKVDPVEAQSQRVDRLSSVPIEHRGRRDSGDRDLPELVSD